MKQRNNQRKKLTVWVRMQAPSSWRHTSTYLNYLKKGMSFITILMMMAIWLASAASSAFAQEKTNVDIFALNADRTLYGKTDGSQITSNPVPGYNIIRTFRNSAGQLVLLTLNGNTGEYITYAATKYLGSSKASGNPEKELRCNAAEFVKIGGVTKLVTQDSFTGLIRMIPVSDDGELNLNAMTKALVLDMRDKNLFGVYESQTPIFLYESSLLMTGVNTWTGEMATYSLNNMQKVVTTTWTRGWTSMDYLKIGNVTYRLLYKASGDPYKKPGESGDQARRFVIETAELDGSSQGIQNKYLAAEMGDLSSVRFVQFPAARTGYNYGILFYRRTTGDYDIYGFDPQIGLGNKIDEGQLKSGAWPDAPAAPPYIDVVPYLINSNTFLAFVSPDNATPLGYEQAEQMGQLMHDSLWNNTVGYQFILAQSGRIFFSRGYGKKKLDHDASAETDMTTRSHLNIGSVSKVITATTVLKLAQQNKISLNDYISEHLNFGQVEPYKWPNFTPILNLLTHTSGVSENKCTADTGNLTVDCKDFFKLDSDASCGYVAGKYKCNYSYNNSNFIAARKIIENVTGAKDSMEIDDQTHKLWADSLDLPITCKVAPSAFYYGPCDGAGDCFSYAGKSWRRYWPAGDYSWSEFCSSGGWYASSRELIQFLSGIRYRAVLDFNFTNILVRTDLKDINDAGIAIGWDPPWYADGKKNLGKGGYLPMNGTAARAYITRLPHNCDAVVQLNSESELKATGLLRDSFKTAVLGGG